MSEHLTFFGTFTNQTEDLYWKLQELYKLERLENLTNEQKSALVTRRIEVRSAIYRFRKLLESIEREHNLEPLQVIKPAIALEEGNHGNTTN